MKRNLFVTIPADQKRLLDRAAELWATVNDSVYSRVVALLVQGQKPGPDGGTTFYHGDGGLPTVQFILGQLLTPDSAEYTALEYQRLNPQGDYAKFMDDVEFLNAYIGLSITTQKQQDASDTNNEHAGAAAATA
jgi:hypothetical protein